MPRSSHCQQSFIRPFLSVIAILVLISFMMMILKHNSCERNKRMENFNPIIGATYADGCDKMPVPENIREESRSPPFYNLSTVRKGDFCSYKNYIYPPPMDYPPVESCPFFDNRFQYWNTAVLSHPQTSYLV